MMSDEDSNLAIVLIDGADMREIVSNPLAILKRSSGRPRLLWS